MRRRTAGVGVAVLAVASLIAGGCGASPRSHAADAASTTTSSSTTAPGASPTASTTRTPAPSTTSATLLRRPSARVTTTSTTASPPDNGQTDPGRGDVQPTATDDGSQGPPGAFARTLLRATPATTIVIERFAQDGATVAESSITRSAGVVHDVSGKVVDVRPLRPLAGGARSWSADDLRATADAAATVPQGGGKAVVHLLQVHGTFEGSDEVLGVAVRGDVIAFFPDSIDGSTTPLVSAAAIDDAVVLHELGHVLGLVDLARNTGRADPDHPGHSKNTKSVMYWAVESSLVGQVLNGPPPKDFDGDDLADLRALRSGA